MKKGLFPGQRPPAFTAGDSHPAELLFHPRCGASWEGRAPEQALTLCGDHDAYFWNTIRGAEPDLLLIRNGRRYGFEFKCGGEEKTVSMPLADQDERRPEKGVAFIYSAGAGFGGDLNTPFPGGTMGALAKADLCRPQCLFLGHSRLHMGVKRLHELRR